MNLKYDPKTQNYINIPAEHPTSVLINSFSFWAMITCLATGILLNFGDNFFTRPSNSLISESTSIILGDVSLMLAVLFFIINIIAYTLQHRLRQEDIKKISSKRAK